MRFYLCCRHFSRIRGRLLRDMAEPDRMMICHLTAVSTFDLLLIYLIFQSLLSPL
ncbi:hypothetical protein GQ44DRAFT_758690 [Phaeosphaeriaceae sp. PMI808]|nr:hypothetical protein GQ44DRAFT_758690 [Phaeosphaeriaceae sp. PMI808]